MTRSPLLKAAAALALAAALPAGAEPRCDVALLHGLGMAPEQLLPCVRSVAANPQSVGGELLRAALPALATAAFTRPAADEAGLGRRLIAELQRRGALGPDDHATLREILLANGRLDEAATDRAADPAAVARAEPVRRPLAQPPRPGEARYWRWDVRGGALDEQAVDLAHGTHLVVVVAPGCHFCARAAADADKDPALSALFGGALWITRPEQDLAPSYWTHWNDAHPREPMLLVLDTRGWDVPAQWATPQFRFFRDGQVVASVMGWSPASRVALLRTAHDLALTNG